MATGKDTSPTTATPLAAQQPRGRLRWLLIGLGLIATVVAVFLSPIRSYALTGASYGARVACSCRFVGGRDLADCRKDFEPGMELVTLGEDTAGMSVTARFALFFSQTATYREGHGCMLEPW